MTSVPSGTLNDLRDESALAAYIQDARRRLREDWQPSRGGRAWGQAHADLLDSAVRRLFHLALDRSGGTASGVTVLATGGYGQRVLAPYSDIDLTFLVDRDDDPPVLRAAFRLVMDVLMSGVRIKVGYAYRHVSDIAKGGLDHQSQTALLDARFVAGDGALFARFDQAYARSLQIADFLFRKDAERARVRARAGVTPLAMEPDIKEGAGGLRDIQTALWMAQARFDKSGDALWRELARRKILTRDEIRALQEAREHLYRIRHLVHLQAGERRDRLSIAAQEAAAERLGIVQEADRPPVEALMRAHYQAAQRIDQLSEKITQRCLDAPLPLGRNSGLASLRRSVIVVEPERVHGDILWPMIALEFCQRYDLELAPATAEAAERTIAAAPQDLPVEEMGARFLSLLGQPGDTVATLRRLLRIGLMQRLLPELADCMTLIPYDPAHAFTVGEHTLRVVANLVCLRESPGDGPQPYPEVFSRVIDPVVLLLAGVLHDVGKQWPRLVDGTRAPHEVTGAAAVPAIGQRLGCSEEQIERTVRLVRHHLLLAEVSRLRDLTRPETARDVARILADQDMLQMLYILTWADTSAVGPGIWTERNAHLLDELFERTAAALESDSPSETSDAERETRRLDQLRERLRRRFTTGGEGNAAEVEAMRQHIEAMPAAYLLNATPETMALHVALITALLSGEADGDVVADLRTVMPESRQTELTVVAYDDPLPGLLAKVTGVLYAFDIRLHAAQVFTRRHDDGRGIVIDTLLVDFRDRALDRALRGEVAAALRRVLGGEETIGDLLARRRRPEATLGAVKSLQLAGEPDTADLLLLDATFAPGSGSVHALATRLSQLGWNIHAARVSTWAGNARCAVYVSDAATGGAGSEADWKRLWHALVAA